MSRLEDLKTELADDAAKTNLECFCKWVTRNGNKWYDTAAVDPELQEIVATSVEYLRLRRKLERNRLEPNLVLARS